MILFVIGILMIIAGIVLAFVLKGKKEGSPLIGFAPAALGVILIVLSCFTSVPTGHTGVVTTFGKVESTTLDAGINCKAPWQKVICMDNRIQKDTLELSCFSSDIQEVTMNYTVNYQIKKSDAMTIYSTVGTEYFNTVITPCITESVKTVTAKYTAESLVADRTDLANAIKENLTGKLDSYNIILVSASIENLDFTDAFTDAVESKQVAEQNKLKAEQEAEQKRIEAQGEADAQIIKAEAEAESNEKISNSLTKEILDKMYYDTWNGVLPNVVGSDSTIVVPEGTTEETTESATE